MKVFLFFSSVSPVLPIIWGIVVFRHLDYLSKTFLGYLVIAITVGIGVMVLGMNHIHNLWLAQFFIPIQYCFLVWIFSIRLSKESVRQLFRWSIPFFVVAWVIIVSFFEDVNSFSIISSPLAYVLLIMVASYSLFDTNKDNSSPILKIPTFWISSGSLIYFSGTLALIILSNQFLKSSSESLKTAWMFQTTANIMSYLVFIGAFSCQYRPRNSGGS